MFMKGLGGVEERTNPLRGGNSVLLRDTYRDNIWTFGTLFETQRVSDPRRTPVLDID